MRHTKSEVKLVLVGRGPDEEALRQQAKDAGVGSKVVFEIGPDDDRLYELYLGARGVYFGPFDEDYGYITIEGFAAHRPVITLADAGGPLEFVAHAETGLIAPPEPKAIAEAFDRLEGDEPLARRLGDAGHALLRERVPTWPEVVERLLE